MVDAMKQKSITPRVSVVIVTYRSMKEIPGCVESLRKQSVPTEIFLVDNASPDGTGQMVAEYAERFDNVHAILNRENVGLAAGNNCLLGQCSGDYVLVLNPDTVLQPDTLERMVRFLDEHDDVGVLGPKCVYEDGTPHVSFHRHWGILHVLAWRIIPYRFTRRIYDLFSSLEFQDVLFVSGACLLIRREIFEKIGGYDPEYFLTVEDAIDVCIRANRTGSRVVFLPEAQIVHYTGRSATQAPYLVVWHANRGTIYHFLKHKGKLQALFVSGLLAGAAAARVLVAGIAGVAIPRYRSVASIYARVLRHVVLENPIREKRERVHEEHVQRALQAVTAHVAHSPARAHIVILNWNNYADTASCLESIRDLEYGNREVVVVDNGSTDESVTQIRKSYPDTKVIEAGHNLGFASGCNVGIRYALSHGCDFVWLLNNDTTVDRLALSMLVERATRYPKVGVVGSAIYDMEYPEHLQAWGGGYVNFWLGRSRHFLHPVADESIDFITGASMFITRRAIESIGLLDENFFMYWEDADYCYRLQKAGWKLAVAGGSRIWHKGSASIGKASIQLDRYFNASARRFFRKHAPVPAVPIWTASALRVGKRVIRGDWEHARAVLEEGSRPGTGHSGMRGSHAGALEAERRRG